MNQSQILDIAPLAKRIKYYLTLQELFFLGTVMFVKLGICLNVVNGPFRLRVEFVIIPTKMLIMRNPFRNQYNYHSKY